VWRAAPYRARSTWLMNGTTLASVRKLKDSQDRYIWQPSLIPGQPETIRDRPVKVLWLGEVVSGYAAEAA